MEIGVSIWTVVSVHLDGVGIGIWLHAWTENYSADLKL
jgi:hypothetical protein